MLCNLKPPIHAIHKRLHPFYLVNKKQTTLSDLIRTSTVWDHIRENAKQKEIFIDTINGYQEHCHCLVSLGIGQTIGKIMQLIKGESSFWINKNNLCAGKFEWQDEYFALSVSQSMLGRVRNYIKNQEEHHKKEQFEQEYQQLKEINGSENNLAKAKNSNIHIPLAEASGN